MPETQVVLRNSERKLFKQCQWKWEREYVDRLKPRLKESPALWFGTGIHLALEKYYVPGRERGEDPREVFKRYVQETDAEMRYVSTSDPLGNHEESVQAMELGIDMLGGYLDKYEGDPWMEVIATEQDFQIRLPYDRAYKDKGAGEFSLEEDKAILVGSIDLVYRDTRTNKVWLKDYKTARALGSQNTQFLPMDDQAGLYCAVAERVLKHLGLIGDKEKVQGIVFDYLVKAKTDTRPVNKDGMATNRPTKQHYIDAIMTHDPDLDEARLKKTKVADLEKECADKGIVVFGDVSKSQPTKRYDRVEVRRTKAKSVNQIHRVQQDLTSMSLVRYNVVKATKTPGTHCAYCPFLEICQLDEDNKDWQDLASDLYKEWDPYESHREEIK